MITLLLVEWALSQLHKSNRHMLRIMLKLLKFICQGTIISSSPLPTTKTRKNYISSLKKKTKTKTNYFYVYVFFSQTQQTLAKRVELPDMLRGLVPALFWACLPDPDSCCCSHSKSRPISSIVNSMCFCLLFLPNDSLIKLK